MGGSDCPVIVCVWPFSLLMSHSPPPQPSWGLQAPAVLVQESQRLAGISFIFFAAIGLKWQVSVREEREGLLLLRRLSTLLWSEPRGEAPCLHSVLLRFGKDRTREILSPMAPPPPPKLSLSLRWCYTAGPRCKTVHSRCCCGQEPLSTDSSL